MKTKLVIFIGCLFLLSGMVYVDTAFAVYPLSTPQVIGVRTLPDFTPDSSKDVSIKIDVDEANAPSGLIVNEYIPLGWTLISATPPPESGPDPDTGKINWLFFKRTGVEDTTITYNLSVPAGESGTKTFSGELKYTDPDGVSVTEPIGGDTQVCVPTGLPDNNCDGVDDDCDGTPDDDYVVTQTNCGIGECAATGDKTCVNGEEVDSCKPLPKPEDTEVTCNDGLDNDCDGLIDPLDPDCPYIVYYCDEDGDGFIASSMTDACLGEGCVPEGCQIKAGDDCADNDPSIHPGADDSNCNGVDENCDGTSDDGYAVTQTTCGVGECATTGDKTCVEGKEVNSCTPLLPKPEGSEATCTDKKDNDCDGAVDILDSDCGPEITVTPARVDFGCVDTDGSESRTLKITNTGNMVLNTMPITIDDAQFEVVKDSCDGFEIAPNDTLCTVEVAFEPKQQGETDSAVNSANLTITSSDVPEITKNVPLRGTWILSAKDVDGDCIPDSEDVDDKDATIASPPSAAGTGKITIDAPDGTFLTDVQSLSDDDPVVNQEGKPAGHEFTDGLVSFIVHVANDGDTVKVDITFPSLNPDDDNKYYKVDEAGFHEFSGAVFNGNNVTLTLTDGGDGDEDGVENGEIVEPGGVGSQAVPAEICDDGIDNDHDGNTDCDDSDCAQASNCATAPPASDTGGGDTGTGKCFIATAAYGSYMADDVMVLREFRDKYLMPNSLGRALVTDVYYRYSPPIADYIARHESLRTVTRIALAPIVYSVKYPFVLVGMMAIGGVVVIRRKRRRK